jgi:hypothetical protein
VDPYDIPQAVAERVMAIALGICVQYHTNNTGSQGLRFAIISDCARLPVEIPIDFEQGTPLCLQLRLYLPPKNLARARCSQYFPAMVGF